MPAASRQGIFRNTAIFSVFTGLSRVAGLVREAVSARYFGTTGAMDAFRIAFQVPNLVRALVADAALSSAFVPVFTDLLQRGRRREAAHLAASLLGLIVVVVGVVTVVFMLLAPVIMPLFMDGDASTRQKQLAVGLTQVMFPIVLLLGINGLFVGVLNALDHFSVPAIAPLAWNVVIIVGIIALRGLFEGSAQIYAYAIGIVAGTVVQLGMCFPVLRRMGFPLRISFDWHDPNIRRVLTLMLPVTISLGVINIDLLVNSVLALRISEGAASAIDFAFRVYMLPQGMFSVAIATVLFPALARLVSDRDMLGLQRWASKGVRLIFLALIPCAAATVALAEPIVRLIYERGEFDARSTQLTAEALLWFSFSLPFAGANLLLTRALFALQRPWFPTRLAVLALVVNVAVSLALYRPFGIAGIVIGTAVSSLVMMVLQMLVLRVQAGGFELAQTAQAFVIMTVAAVAFGFASHAVWSLLDGALGRSLPAQIVSVGFGLAAGFVVYGALVTVARVPEVAQLRRMIAERT